MISSVVILTFNRKDHVLDCVESVIHQNFKGDYEIIVIDNWSKDGSFEALNQNFRVFQMLKL